MGAPLARTITRVSELDDWDKDSFSVDTPVPIYNPTTGKFEGGAGGGDSLADDICLYFDGGPINVNHGYFWKQAPTEYTLFFYEGIVFCLDGCLYWWSDGWGGLHAFLFGCSPSGGRLQLFGNLYDGTTIRSFGSYNTFPPDGWHHIAVGYDGARIVIKLDGVPCSYLAFTGVRRIPQANSEGTLYFGGSSHSNAKGYARGHRGFEGICPVDLMIYNKPERVFGNAYRLDNDSNILHPNIAADFSCGPVKVIPDYSDGFEGQTHPGRLSVSYDSTFLGGANADLDLPGLGLPRWVRLPFVQGDYIGPDPDLTPTATFYTFDSFKRKDVVPFWAEGTDLGLGNTEVGSKPWLNSLDYGIQSGEVFIKQNTFQSTYHDCEQVNYEVVWERRDLTGILPASTEEFNFGFRMVDNAHKHAIYVDGYNQIYIAVFDGDPFSATYIGNVIPQIAPNWTKLRARVNGTLVEVFREDDLVPVCFGTMTKFLTATNVGFRLSMAHSRFRSITTKPL